MFKIFSKENFTPKIFIEKRTFYVVSIRRKIFSLSLMQSLPHKEGETTLEDGGSSQSTTESKGGLQLMVKGGGEGGMLTMMDN